MGESIQLFGDYERVGVPGRHRDFKSDAGFGTVSEIMMPYGEGEGVDEFVVTFAVEPPTEVRLRPEVSPAQALSIIGDQTKSRSLIKRAVVGYFVGVSDGAG